MSDQGAHGRIPAWTRVIALPAQVDILTAPDAGKDLADAFEPDISVVIADFTRTEFCDTSGIREVVKARQLAQDGGVDLGW